MLVPRLLLLTGATGLLGRYLLRELLLEGNQVAVLVRNSAASSARDRIRSILRLWNEERGLALPEPRVLSGDLCASGFGLKAADLRWLSRNCKAVVHAGASLAFRTTLENEPFGTNVEGTRNLLNFCRQAGIAEFHHVSTAFVCGVNPEQPVLEKHTARDRTFNNPYEQSKWEAECLVRGFSGIQSTIYRPSIIVGDSKTGYTSTYHGIYKFAEMALRLAQSSRGKFQLNIRLPMTGNELRNLVPVDWVAKAISRIVAEPGLHGKVYHLVSDSPIPVRLIKQVADDVLHLTGIAWGGAEVMAKPSIVERHFLELLQQYVPYLQGDPVFDASNLSAAIPDMPPPAIDQTVLARLFEFAKRNQWGAEQPSPGESEWNDCRQYVEDTFPKLARRSALGRRIELEVAVGIDVRGSTGGQWTLRWEAGELVSIQLGLEADVNVVYRMDAGTFASITDGRESPAQAFFDQRLQLEGDVEKGLNLAVWFEQLLHEKTAEPVEQNRRELHESRR